MNAIKLALVLCAFALPVALAFAELAEAKTRSHRRHVSDRHRYEERRDRATPRIEDFQRYRRDRRGSEWDSSCFSLPYLPQQYACSSRGGDGGGM
jgi:hypothetical protein